MNILALDLAQRVGHARLGDAGVPIIGSREFTGRSALAELRKWLVGMVVAHRLETVAVESLFVGQNAATAIDAAYMHGVVREVMQAHNLRFIDLTAGAWRSHFIGVTQAPAHVGKGLNKSAKSARRRAWLKKAARAECERRGWQVTNDDQADAAGILDCARCLMDRRYGANSTPLFESAL